MDEKRSIICYKDEYTCMGLIRLCFAEFEQDHLGLYFNITFLESKGSKDETYPFEKA